MNRLVTLTAGAALLIASIGCSSCPLSRRTASYSQCAPVASGCAPVTDSCGNVMGATGAPVISGTTAPGVITPTPEYYTPSTR
jgi:hypothetical protein